MLLAAAPAVSHAQSPAQKQATAAKLLDALKHAPNEAAAAGLELRLRQLWLNAGSPAVTLLMSRGLREMKAGETAAAIADFGDAIVLDPKLAEAYHQRAIVRYQAGDTVGAIADIEGALRQEPHDFAALETLSHIAEARSNWKGAYEAWQKVLEIDPMTPGGQDRLKDLKRKAFGEET
jgi:tetratricopeptide (TPR) repeat protein